MIQLDKVSRTFQVGDQQVLALREVSLSIAAGEYIAIMGPSGSGKSTMLNLLGLLDRPSSGHYSLDGRDVTGLNEAESARVRREKIGFVFQFFHLVPRLDAAANIALPMVLAGVAPAELAVVPLQDLLELGEEARFNTPGTTEGNWSWRLQGSIADLAGPIHGYGAMAARYGRGLVVGAAAGG